MQSLQEMVDVNTILGDPVETPDGNVILPVSTVSFGFAAGGTEYQASEDRNRQEGSNSSYPWQQWSRYVPSSCSFLGVGQGKSG